MRKMFEVSCQEETSELIEVASPANIKTVHSTGPNSSICVSQSRLLGQDEARHAGTWAGQLVWDWSGRPELEPSGASQPMVDELKETAGKIPAGEDKVKKWKI